MTNASRNSEDAAPAKPSSPLLIVAAWALVVLPTAWGLTFTVQNALKIFTAPAPAASSPASPAQKTPTPEGSSSAKQPHRVRSTGAAIIAVTPARLGPICPSLLIQR